MKIRLYILLILTTLFACTKEVVKETQPVSIGFSVGSTSSPSRLPSGGDTIPLFFARAADSPSAVWSTLTSAEEPLNGFGEGIISAYMICNDPEEGGDIHFNSPQYFDFNTDNKAHLIGYLPQCDSFRAGVSGWETMALSWKLDGKKDVLISKPLSGNQSSMPKEVLFIHRLCWLQFYITAYDSICKNIWGDVVSLTLLDTNNELTYAPPTTYSFSGSGIINTFKEDSTLPDSTGLDGVLQSSYASSRFFSQAYAPCVSYDSKTESHFRMKIKTTHYEENVSLVIKKDNEIVADLSSGNIYKILLVFRMGNVVIEPQILPWTEEIVEGVIK